MATFKGREAAVLENDIARVTVLIHGGHIAEILHKPSGVNPLWVPPWKSVEPSRYDSEDPSYGPTPEGRLLSGIMGHNLCLDCFGPPSSKEAEAGMTLHGEASQVTYSAEARDHELTLSALLPMSQLHVRRRISFAAPDEAVVQFSETVRNLTPLDRPLAWTQHVTVGPPFLERGATQIRIPAHYSHVYEQPDFDYFRFRFGSDFTWPYAPTPDGGEIDLQVFPAAERSSGLTTHLIEQSRADAFFTVFSPSLKVELGYRWRRDDFPWIAMWEENCSRAQPPWNGNTLALGLEFGVSPLPETRKRMIERGSMFDTPAYRWLPARSALTVRYSAYIRAAEHQSSLD